MLFRELVRVSAELAETRARSTKTALLARALGQLASDEALIAVAYLTGELPQGKIGVGYATLRDLTQTQAAVEPTLSILEVDQVFTCLAEIRGPGSAKERLRQLSALFLRATPEEQHFLLRLGVGELRQGALEGVMLDAVAKAAQVPVAALRRAAMLCGSVPTAAAAALREGERGLERFRLQLLQPISPMLADAASDADEALERWPEAAAEFKLDGARIQVHRSGSDVRVFSRSLHDVTGAVPEIVEAVLALPVKQLIADGEALAFQKNGLPEPFQITMRRFGRRSNVAELRDQLPLSAYFFDCLHLDGQDLIDHEARERHRAQSSVLPEALCIPREHVQSADAARAFLERALRLGHEGILVKSLSAPYEAGRRGSGWLKVKPAHTLDLLVLAAEWGSGRRSGWLSNLHLGARDPRSGGFVMLGKTFKGMTDEMLRWQTQRFQELEVSRDAVTVYLRPELVVEIAFDGVQASPHYPGGLALRFARVKRYRPDKRPEETDTIDTVRAIHARELASDGEQVASESAGAADTNDHSR